MATPVGERTETLRRSLGAYGEGIFPVTFVNTEKSQELQLFGTYLLEVGSFHLVLRDGERKAMLYEWPFEKIRRYGKDTGTFTFESGRKCQTGEGLFILNTSQGEEIFEMVRSKLAIIRARRREDQQASNHVTNTEGKHVTNPSKTVMTSKLLTKKQSSNNAPGTVTSSAGQVDSREKANAIKYRPDSLRKRSNEKRAKANDYEQAAQEKRALSHEEPEYTMSQLVEKAAQLQHLEGGASEDGYEQINFKNPMSPQRFDPPVMTQSPNLYNEQSTVFRAEASSEEESVYAQEYYDVAPSVAPSDGDYSTVYQHWQMQHK